MSELRLDPFTGRYAVIAPARSGLGAARPAGLPERNEHCPFCRGHEADTEATILAWPSEGPWRVRVVANRFPIVEPGEQVSLTSGALPARGAHEIVIDSDAHGADLGDLDDEHAAALVRVYRDRVRALEARAEHAVLFRNRGRRAGSSQPHPHTQLAGLDFVPIDVAHRWERAQAHHRAAGRSLWASSLDDELRAGTRIVESTTSIVTFCPFAPTRPWEQRLMPRTAGRFAAIDDALARDLGRALVRAHARLRRVLGEVDYNVVLRQPPARALGPAAGWHLELLPRLGGDAGFELSTECMVVVVAPETAAAALAAA
ncbi:MAG: hypothetical protein IT378_07720 [Sandaracinaceae bacterium]|nr:hypothetical protein [Sandaracinaceae bacterium]